MNSFRSFLAEQFRRPDGSLKSEPGYLYHATNEENLRSIRTSGGLDIFGPSHGTDQKAWPDGEEEDRSYWTDKAGIAWCFAPEDGVPVLLRALQSSSFVRESGTGDFYSKARIASSDLEVMMYDGVWVSLQFI